MFEKMYVRATLINWKATLPVIAVIVVVALVIAANYHWLPQETLVAVNWEDGPSIGGGTRP